MFMRIIYIMTDRFEWISCFCL